MKTLRYFFLGSFALLLGVLSVSLQPTDANAASVYDDMLHVWQTQPTLDNPNVSDAINLGTGDIVDLILSDDAQDVTELQKTQFINAFENGSVIILAEYQGIGLGYTIRVNATHFPRPILFGSLVTVHADLTFHLHQAPYGTQCLGDKCNIYVQGYNSNSEFIISSPPPPGTDVWIITSSYDLDYPPGYEGPEIPSEGFVEPEYPLSDEKPNFSISRLIAYQLTAHDLNFNTFDPTLFTCADELAPIIHYTLTSFSDGASGINISGSQSSTVQFDFDMTGATPGKYRLAGTYECFEDVVFTQTAEIFFQIDVNGNQSFNAFTDCFIETFPFIDFQGCIDNMLVVINIMGVKIPSTLAALGEVPPGECHTLTVLNHWLSLPNPTVCKQVPSNVRSIITPFVTFALGLMTIKFLAQRRRDDL